jgi:2'-5' RNA ligase
LANEFELRLELFGFARESRSFHPHLTLARIKGRPPRELFDIIRRGSETHFGTVEVRSIELIRSELHHNGARYSLISSHELGVTD